MKSIKINWSQYKHIVSYIAVGSGVIDTVAGWVTQQGYNKPLIVCDCNTYKLAGSRVVESLGKAGVDVVLYCFPEEEPLPDEFSIGRLLAAYTPDIDIIIGVGSGTINDLCTFTGASTGCPSVIVGTAPSMDGYASLGSAMLLGGIKVTPPTQCPAAIFCDTDILVKAPMEMITAGLGDMLGKFTSLADWRLSHLLTAEPIPEDIFGLMQSALDKIMASVSGILHRDPAAVESLTEGLILSGIAMSLYGDSRPASGTEHHLAHFWEMRMLVQGRKPALHGIKVGLATVIALHMWKRLDAYLSNEFGDVPVAGGLPGRDYCADIRRLYGTSAENILKTENPVYTAGQIKQHREEILDIARSLPSPGIIAEILCSCGMRVHPKTIGLDSGTLTESIVYARDRKKTCTLLQLLGSLDLLDVFASNAETYFAKDVFDGVKCFVLDMDGTIYLGDRLFPYTPDFLEGLKKHGFDYVFFTNNSSQNAAHYINKLRHMNIDISGSKLLMSTHVLLDHLVSVNAPRNVFVAGTKALMDDFEAAGYTLTGYEDGDEAPGFVVLGFDTDMDYGRLTRLCDYVRRGLPYYGVNTDFNCPVDGGFIPDCGSLAAAVFSSTGILPEFFGKPSRRALDYIVKKTGYREDELCFIGDRLYTDIAITSNSAARSVLVLSGETKREDLTIIHRRGIDAPPGIPDLIVRDLSELMLFI